LLNVSVNMRYDAVPLGTWFSTFRDNEMVSSSGVWPQISLARNQNPSYATSHCRWRSNNLYL